MNITKKVLAGTLIGAVNICLGAGGGMLTVPLYNKMGMDQKQAQINAVATVLPISIISSIIYLFQGNVNFNDAYIYLIPGLIGSVLGTFVIKKASNNILTVFFGIFMIWSGIRMLIK